MYLSRLLLLFALWAWSAAVERRVNEMQRNRFWDVGSDVKGWGISSWSFSVTLVRDSWIYRSSFFSLQKTWIFTLRISVFWKDHDSLRSPFFQDCIAVKLSHSVILQPQQQVQEKRQQLFSMVPVFSLLESHVVSTSEFPGLSYTYAS